MIDINELPDTEFYRMFKQQFLKATQEGKEYFGFVVDDNGHCYETEKAPGVISEEEDGLKITHFSDNLTIFERRR